MVFCFHDLTKINIGHGLSLKKQINDWKEMPKKKVKSPGGSLKEIFDEVIEIEENPEFMTINIHTAKTVHLNERTSVNFKVGVHKMSFEKAEAALEAKIGTETN